jgi:hypothetical protein
MGEKITNLARLWVNPHDYTQQTGIAPLFLSPKASATGTGLFYWVVVVRCACGKVELDDGLRCAAPILQVRCNRAY